jgi:hypothetical protein
LAQLREVYRAAFGPQGLTIAPCGRAATRKLIGRSWYTYLFEQAAKSITAAHIPLFADSARDRFQWAAKYFSLLLVLVALWTVTHRYTGLHGDASLYAMQAYARIHPNLQHDLFLKNTSQDTYTIFSRFYAATITRMGLGGAALLLMIVCKVWFFAASWYLSRGVSNRDASFFALILLIVISGAYGAFGVFHYAEDWLTARSLAEPLVVTAVAMFLRGWKLIGVLIGFVAMWVHPLIALPGVLLLLCLSTSGRKSVVAAAASVIISLGIAVIASMTAPRHGVFTVMDPDWLVVVRERSQFLFLQLWRGVDWGQNVLPFISLTLSAWALNDASVRRLCIAAILIGATGLAVALVGSLIGPASILLQGQAWRWVWVTRFVSVLLLAPTVLAAWRHERSGSLCAILAISAWTMPAIDGAGCMGAALVVWSIRERIHSQIGFRVRWLNLLVIALIGAWTIRGNSALTVLLASASESALMRVRGIFGLQIVSAAIACIAGFWILRCRSLPALAATCAALLAVSIIFLPSAFGKSRREEKSWNIGEFSDWQKLIAPDSNVLVLPSRFSANFAWFTLERPSYLTVDQSSGVVFSRATALEVRRRSAVLMPLMSPDWMLLSTMAAARTGGGPDQLPIRPLTRDRLVAICVDPQQDFVIAREDVGFKRVRHDNPGPWKDWNLYDCRRVRNAPY